MRRLLKSLAKCSPELKGNMMKPHIGLTSAPLFVAAVLGSIASVCLGSGDQGDVASGRQVYMRNCAVCHGDDGKGKSGPRLVGNSLSLDKIEKKVTDGGSQMPSFKKQLSP